MSGLMLFLSGASLSIAAAELFLLDHRGQAAFFAAIAMLELAVGVTIS